MQLKRLNKAVLGGLVAMTAATGLIASTIQPASADPTRPYAAVGSDTIQDVWNGLTNDFGAPIPSVASWNAFAQGTTAEDTGSLIQTKTLTPWFPRPKGSGNGQRALSAVWDLAYNGTWPASGTNATDLNGWTDADANAPVDFSRSSSGPAAAGTSLKFMPMARDAVSVAYKPSGAFDNINFTTAEIAAVFGQNCTDTGNVTFAGCTQGGATTAGTTVSYNGVAIHPRLPQNGSGTYEFFNNATFGNLTSVGLQVDTAGNSLEENRTSTLPNAGDLICFSAAQWIAQERGVTNPQGAAPTVAGLKLASINSLVPVTGTGASAAPGALYGAKVGSNYTTVPVAAIGTYNRDVYNVVPTSFLTGTLKQTTLANTILGAGGLNSGAARAIIGNYGFGTLSYIGNGANFKDAAFRH
ncbi:MAG: hypothetical protein J7518_10905 [Nocardioidaceae bacterium]|nr:hypothetical protein [Nocardioidaceae bacterium]